MTAGKRLATVVGIHCIYDSIYLW